MYKTEKFDAASFEPKRFESDHTITLRGKEIKYHTVCEDNVFYDDAGKPIATLFSYSYFNKSDKNPTVRFDNDGLQGNNKLLLHK